MMNSSAQLNHSLQEISSKNSSPATRRNVRHSLSNMVNNYDDKNYIQHHQIHKCNKCQIQTTGQYLQKHAYSVNNIGQCSNFIQSYFQLINDNIEESFVKNNINLFDIPFLIDDSILYTNSVEKIKANPPTNGQNDENIIYLSKELFELLQMNENDSIRCIDLLSNEYQFFNVQSYGLFKNSLSIGFNHHNNSNNDQMMKKISNSNHRLLLKINLKINSIRLSSIYLSFEREFQDQIIYLNICNNIKKYLRKKVIDFDQNTLKIIMNNVEYSLRIHSKNYDHHNNDGGKELNDSLINEFVNLLQISKRNSLNTEHQQRKLLAYLINDETKIIFQPLFCQQHTEALVANNKNQIKFVGYKNQQKLLAKIFKLQNDTIAHKHVLITGPTGCGKTLLVRQFLEKLIGQMNIITLPNIIFLSKQFEYEKINQFVKNLINLQPIVLFIDNLEDLFVDKSDQFQTKRMISWFKLLFDTLKRYDTKNVIIVGITNRSESIDLSMKQIDRFEIEINVPIPTIDDRQLIFEEILTYYPHDLNDEKIRQLIETAHGFSGSDLHLLCKNYMMKYGDQKGDQPPLQIEFDKMYQLILQTKPSVMREITAPLETPNIRWSDIGGMTKLKQLLEECIVLPIKHPEIFTRFNIDPPKGILMYGPPGCCKTMIGKALACESGLNFFSIKGPELFNKYVGESERSVRDIFKNARSASPSILFFDEIDALASERGGGANSNTGQSSAVGDRVLAQLLTEIDGIEKLEKVVIIAATNRPDIVDKALLRPGRLDSIVYVPLPDYETRKEIFRIRLSKMPINYTNDDEAITFDQLIDILAKKSDGYSGAEIQAICQRSALLSIQNNRNNEKIDYQYFLRSFNLIRPQTSPETIEFYEKFASKFNIM